MHFSYTLTKKFGAVGGQTYDCGGAWPLLPSHIELPLYISLGQQIIAMSMSVCLSVCESSCPPAYKRTPKLYQIFCTFPACALVVARSLSGGVSVLCTSGFEGDVITILIHVMDSMAQATQFTMYSQSYSPGSSRDLTETDLPRAAQAGPGRSLTSTIALS